MPCGEEVRRQFKAIPGIMERTAKRYAACVDLVTKTALRRNGGCRYITVLTPAIVWGHTQWLWAVLMGSIVVGIFMAISMTTGGAWDNAKKYIESGHHGGKGSAARTAAVTGDTVGDPYKDTAD